MTAQKKKLPRKLKKLITAMNYQPGNIIENVPTMGMLFTPQMKWAR
jgi:hypothetical protein